MAKTSRKYKESVKPGWFDDEIDYYARTFAVPKKAAKKMLHEKIAAIMKKHNCTLAEAYEGYNLDRCHRIDRELFIETMIEQGMSRKAAEAMADGSVIYF